MRTAIHTYSFRDKFKQDKSFDILQALDVAAEAGFGGIEIMAGAAGAPPGDLGSDDPSHLAQIMGYARSRGIEVLSLSTYNDFAFVKNEAWRQDNIAYVKRWTKIAGDLGVPNIRLLTGYIAEGTPVHTLETLTKEAILECVPVAEKMGVNLSLENHSSVFMSADSIVELIRSIGSKRLTTCPDPTNWATMGFFEPDCPAGVHELVLDSAEKLAPMATQSHLKVRGVADGKLIGWGDDLDELIRRYRRAGYDGALAFESIADGDLLAPLAEAREIVEKAITRVKHERIRTKS